MTGVSNPENTMDNPSNIVSTIGDIRAAIRTTQRQKRDQLEDRREERGKRPLTHTRSSGMQEVDIATLQ